MLFTEILTYRILNFAFYKPVSNVSIIVYFYRILNLS